MSTLAEQIAAVKIEIVAMESCGYDDFADSPEAKRFAAMRAVLTTLEGMDLRKELENAQADADMANTYIASMKEGQRQLCEAIGVERGRDNWPEFMARVRAALTAATDKARREGAEAMREACAWEAESYGDADDLELHAIGLELAQAIRSPRDGHTHIPPLPDPPQNPGDAAPESEE